MTQVLDCLQRAENGTHSCSRCRHELGVANDYRDLANHFDESINALEPVDVNSPVETFVMRHHICPQCGVLFEIEMLAAPEPGA